LAGKELRDAVLVVDETPAAVRESVTDPETHRRLTQRCLALVSPDDRWITAGGRDGWPRGRRPFGAAGRTSTLLARPAVAGRGTTMKGKLCGAKKQRKDETCRAPAMPNGRCRIHGGLSLGGIAHPNFKHGRRSKYFP
jgi:hypothetical protein